MKQELSAGGVIFKTTNEGKDILLLKDMNDNWSFPKGIIEEGENTLEAAKREIQEEVGITSLTLIRDLPVIEYWYVRNNEKIHKKVSYFLFESTEEESLIPQTEEGISDVQWFSLEKAKEVIGYKETNSKLLEEI